MSDGIGAKIIDFFTGGIVKEVGDVVSKAIPDKDLAAKLANDIQMVIEKRISDAQAVSGAIDQIIVQGQNDTNKIEAGSDSPFKSNWRPAIGWICAAALLYQMLLRPLLAYSLQNVYQMPPPSLEFDTLMTLLFGILGLGAYRSVEKVKGVA